MENLDDFLNALGVSSTAPPPEEPQVTSTVSDPEPTTLTDNDYNDILSDMGFEEPSEPDEEELSEEDIRQMEEEDNFDEGPIYTGGGILEQIQNIPPYTVGDVTNAVANAVTSIRDLDAEEDTDWQEAIDSIPHFNYVGTGEVTQVGDLRRDPITGEEQLMTEAGVINLGITSVDTDIATIEGNQSNTHQNPQEDNVYFHIPNGEVITVPIIHEGEQEPHEPEQTVIETHQAVVETPQQQEALISLNSPTLLMDDTTSRFSGAEWYNEIQKQRVIIAGCGGIGSTTIRQIARMVPASMVLYDDDVVETVNMAGQLYCTSDIGKSKVDAMVDMIISYTSMRNIYALKQKFDENCEAGDIMICGFDNMSARKAFFLAWKHHVFSKPIEERRNCLFLDGRLSLSVLQVLCITGDDTDNISRYDTDFLFSDAEADATVCSMKQTTYLACMIGSVMTNLFTNFVAGLLDPIIPYDLPFFTEYDAQHMIFKTEQ